MPIVNSENLDEYPDFAFHQFGIHIYQPGEPLIERHYHDCDEIWIVISGKARVHCGGNDYVVGTGDIVWTKMGEEHELIEILEHPYGHAWMEWALRGQCRSGHLHRN